jgi:predicted Fe-Mo cluster-binding NifX family protein
MKIAISTAGQSPDSLMDERMGRAPYFMVWDPQLKKWEFINNQASLDAGQGAGIQTAKTLIDAGVRVVITGHCGPKAMQVFNQNQIKVITCLGCTAQSALDQYLEGELHSTAMHDVDGHWNR